MTRSKREVFEPNQKLTWLICGRMVVKRSEIEMERLSKRHSTNQNCPLVRRNSDFICKNFKGLAQGSSCGFQDSSGGFRPQSLSYKNCFRSCPFLRKSWNCASGWASKKMRDFLRKFDLNCAILWIVQEIAEVLLAQPLAQLRDLRKNKKPQKYFF